MVCLVLGSLGFRAHLAPPNSGIACDEQRVIFNGKQLEDAELLSAAGVEQEATLNILGRLLGTDDGPLAATTRIMAVSDPALLQAFDQVVELEVRCRRGWCACACCVSRWERGCGRLCLPPPATHPPHGRA